MTDYLTPKQTAEIMGVAVQTLAKWRSQRIGPTFIKLNGIIRYSGGDIEKYLLNHRVESK